MYIIDLVYQKDLGEVERFLPEHKQYLDKYYALNKFICSGRKNPRNGGIILCRAENLQEVKSIIKEDPFNREKIAAYKIIEFEPSKSNNAFKSCL